MTNSKRRTISESGMSEEKRKEYDILTAKMMGD